MLGATDELRLSGMADQDDEDLAVQKVVSYTQSERRGSYTRTVCVWAVIVTSSVDKVVRRAGSCIQALSARANLARRNAN